MNKRKGAISGILGGTVASLLGVFLLWRILYLTEVLVSVFRGEQIPTYRPFYMLEQAGGYLLLAGLIASGTTLILWAGAGAVVGHLAEKRHLSQKDLFRGWYTWGLSFSVIVLIVFVLPLFLDAGTRNDPSFLGTAIFLLVWWIACGIGGGVVSAKLFSRWAAPEEHLAELNLPS